MSAPPPQARRVLVTGAAGFLGQGLISALAQAHSCEAVVAVDAVSFTLLQDQLQLLVQAGVRHLLAGAQSGATEQDYFQALPVVLTVSRLAQPISETPGAVTVIDRKIGRAHV